MDERPVVTVSNLINILSKLPLNMRVVVDGYESGVEDIDLTDTGQVEIKTYTNNKGYYGRHEEVKSGEKGDETAFLVSR